MKILLCTTVLLTLSYVFTTGSAFAAWADQENPTAHKAARSLKELNLKGIPSWDKAVYKSRFKEIRDKKFLTYEGRERRVPWLYARDGCHMRATHFVEEAERLGYEKPKKIFVFGSLQIRGAIIPRGSVEPWFHTAPIVMVNGEPIILDPSVSFSRPLSLKTWLSYIVNDKTKVVYSVCESGTYLPTSSCNKPAPIDRENLEKETQLYLRFETNIARNLGLSFN